MYVASAGGIAPNSKVIRYNGITGAYIDDFVPVGSGGLSGAEGLVFGPDRNLYVTSRVTNQVLRYDGSTGAFLGVFATAGHPFDLVFGPDGNLYVLSFSGTRLEVLRFDGLTGAFIDVFVSSFSGGTDGSSLVFGPDGNLYVTTGFIGNSVRRFNGSTGQFIDTFIPSGSGGLSYATGLLFFTPTRRCPLGQGFWKNHPDTWPVTSVTLGSQTYTQATLQALFDTPPRGDASLILAHQLIAAKLNIANGSDPTPISATIADADSLLSQFGNLLPYNVRTSSAIGQQKVEEWKQRGVSNTRTNKDEGILGEGILGT